MGHLTLWLKIELSPRACKHVSTETLTAVVCKKRCRNFTSSHLKCKRFYRLSCQKPGFLLNASGPRTIFYIFLAVAEILSAAASQPLTAAAREKCFYFLVSGSKHSGQHNTFALEPKKTRVLSLNFGFPKLRRGTSHGLGHPGI